jgi:hypothetical protein
MEPCVAWFPTETVFLSAGLPRSLRLDMDPLFRRESSAVPIKSPGALGKGAPEAERRSLCQTPVATRAEAQVDFSLPGSVQLTSHWPVDGRLCSSLHTPSTSLGRSGPCHFSAPPGDWAFHAALLVRMDGPALSSHASLSLTSPCDLDYPWGNDRLPPPASPFLAPTAERLHHTSSRHCSLHVRPRLPFQ